MYKNIIPDLVSFDTEITEIKGSYFFRRLNFFPATKKKFKYHYRIKIEDFQTPKSYDFRNGYFFKFKSTWFYERTIFKFFTLKLKYDISNRAISFNKTFFLVPFELGGILPIGKLIADIISLDLFLDGNVLIRGCAFEYNNCCTCIIAPSFNGKTTLINQLIDKGCHYIAEDILVINFEENKVYPTSIIRENFGRGINRLLADKLTDNFIIHKKNISELIFLLNSTSDTNLETTCSVLEFIVTNSLAYMGNLFVRSIIFAESNATAFFNRLLRLETLNLKVKILLIKNFNFNSIYEQIYS